MHCSADAVLGDYALWASLRYPCLGLYIFLVVFKRIQCRQGTNMMSAALLSLGVSWWIKQA